MFLQESGQAGRTNLLLPFENELHIVAQFARTHHILKRLQLNHALPLVIVRAAGIDLPVANLRLERLTGPQFQRVGRHHIVMAVDQHCGSFWRHALFRIHQRIAGGGHHPHLIRAGLQQQRPPPFGTGRHLRLAGRIGTHTRNAEQAEPLLQKTGLMFPDVFLYRFHFPVTICLMSFNLFNASMGVRLLMSR